jgi:hypothetical protein
VCLLNDASPRPLAHAQKSLAARTEIASLPNNGVYQEVLKTLDEIMSFLSHMPYFDV